jgi:hypothetical protein
MVAPEPVAKQERQAATRRPGRTQSPRGSAASAAVSRGGHLRHRECQFAVSDPQAGRAARIIAGHDIHSKTHQLNHVASVANAGDQPRGRGRAFLDIKISIAHARVSGQPARGIARGAQPQLARRVRVQPFSIATVRRVSAPLVLSGLPAHLPMARLPGCSVPLMAWRSMRMTYCRLGTPPRTSHSY